MHSAPSGSRRVLLAASMLLAATLACGGFQVRVTPTPKPASTAESTTASPPTASPTPKASPQPTAPVTPAPTTAATAQVAAASAIRQARVAATGGLNIRDKASAKGKQLGRLVGNAVVQVIEGPVQAENMAWYRVDNGKGLTGWVATGPANDPWLVLLDKTPDVAATAAPSAAKLVDRSPKTGDTVQVTTDANQVLTVRTDPGRGATAVAKVPKGVRFKVKGGPVKQDNLTWWELQGDTVSGWAAEGDGQTRWLTPFEP